MVSSSQQLSESASAYCSLLLPFSRLMHGGVDTPLPFAWLATSRGQVALIEIEALLGLWLLSGWRQRGAWLTAILAFSLLGAVSLYLAIDGQRSCGCFGTVEVNPWYTFLLDAAAVLALTLTLPPRRADTRETGWLRELTMTGIRAAVLMALLAVPLLLCGKPADALAWARGDSITIEPEVSDIGEGQPGEGRVP